MSFQWTNHILTKRRDLKGAELLCAMIVANYASADDRCYPGYDKIAADMRLTKRQVQRLIEQLEQKKVFIIHRGKGRGHQTSFELIKGDIDVTISTPEKVTSATPIPEIKGDISDQEKVTFSDVKGDIFDQKTAHIRNEPLEPIRRTHTEAPVSEFSLTDESFLNQLFDALRNFYGVAACLPDEVGWLAVADFADMNGYTVRQVIDCLNHLSGQKWRGGRVSARTVKDNLPEFVKKASEVQWI